MLLSERILDAVAERCRIGNQGSWHQRPRIQNKEDVLRQFTSAMLATPEASGQTCEVKPEEQPRYRTELGCKALFGIYTSHLTVVSGKAYFNDT